MSKLEGTKKMIRAVLLSSKEGIPAHKMNGDYKALTGGGIPFGKLGFISAEDFIRSIPDVVRVSHNRGEVMYHAVADESTAHIQKMVAKQRSKKKKVTSYKGFNSHQRSYAGMKTRFSNATQRRPMAYSPLPRAMPRHTGLLQTPKSIYSSPQVRCAPRAPCAVKKRSAPPPTSRASVYSNPLCGPRSHQHAPVTGVAYAGDRVTARKPCVTTPPVAKKTPQTKRPVRKSGSTPGVRTVTPTAAHGMSVTLRSEGRPVKKSGSAPGVRTITPTSAGGMSVTLRSDGASSATRKPRYGAIQPTCQRKVTVQRPSRTESGVSISPVKFEQAPSRPGNKTTPAIPPRFQRMHGKAEKWKSETLHPTNTTSRENRVSEKVKQRIKKTLAANPSGVHSLDLALLYYEMHCDTLPESVVYDLECGNIKDVATVEKSTCGVREKIIFYPKDEKKPPQRTPLQPKTSHVDTVAKFATTTSLQSKTTDRTSPYWKSEIVKIHDKGGSNALQIEDQIKNQVRDILAKNPLGVYSIKLESIYQNEYKKQLPGRVVSGLECGLISDVAVVEKQTRGNRERVIFYPIANLSTQQLSAKDSKTQSSSPRTLFQTKSKAKTASNTTLAANLSVDNIGDFTKERIKKILSAVPLGVAATSFGGLFYETYKYKLNDAIIQSLVSGELKDVATVEKIRTGNAEKTIIFPLKKLTECKLPKYSAISKKIVKIPQSGKLELASEHEVNVSYIEDCGNFSVQLFSSYDQFLTILEFAKVVEYGRMDTVTIGTEVMTSFEPGRRGRVISASSGEVEVYHVDFGDTRMMPVKNLAPIPPEIARIPALAIACSLYKPHGPQAGWSERSSLKFQQLCIDEKARIKVNSISHPSSTEGQRSCVHTVTCYLDDFNVNGRLLHEELASRTVPAQTVPPCSLPKAEHLEEKVYGASDEIPDDIDSESSYETIDAVSSCGDISSDDEALAGNVPSILPSSEPDLSIGSYSVDSPTTFGGGDVVQPCRERGDYAAKPKQDTAHIKQEPSPLGGEQGDMENLQNINGAKWTSVVNRVAHIKQESSLPGGQGDIENPQSITGAKWSSGVKRTVARNQTIGTEWDPIKTSSAVPSPAGSLETLQDLGGANRISGPRWSPRKTSSKITSPNYPNTTSNTPRDMDALMLSLEGLSISGSASAREGLRSRSMDLDLTPRLPLGIYPTPPLGNTPLSSSRGSLGSPRKLVLGASTPTHHPVYPFVPGGAQSFKNPLSDRSPSISTPIEHAQSPRETKSVETTPGSHHGVPPLYTPPLSGHHNPLGQTGTSLVSHRSFGDVKIESLLDENDNHAPIRGVKGGRSSYPTSVSSCPRDCVYLTAPLQVPWEVRNFGKLVDVVVTHVLSPGTFFMIPVEKMGALDVLTDAMTNFYNANPLPATEVLKDSVYVAPCSVNGVTRWCRVRVCQMVQGFASVLLIDQGVFDCIPVKIICDLSPQFMTFAPFAMCGRLAGVKPKLPTKECVEQVSRMFEERVLGKKLVAHVVKMSKSKDRLIYDVCLCDVSSGEQDEWINDMMVEKWELADYVIDMKPFAKVLTAEG